MNVCHIRRIHIVSSTIRIYLSIIKYPILQMKKFQTNNRIPQMSIMKNTPIVLTRYVSCTFICQISYNDDESSVDESLLEVASAISISFHATGKSTKWGRYTVTNIMPSIVHYLSAVHYEDQCSIRRHCAPEWNNREQQLCR